MRIFYVTRSRFLAECESAVRAGLTDLDAGGTIRLRFEEGGYAGRCVVLISADDPQAFETDWNREDPSRFPVRIKAAATALFRCGRRGRFRILHEDGLLEIAGA